MKRTETQSVQRLVRRSDIVMTIDHFNYYAKATMPPNNAWRTPMLTEAEAVAKAKWFVREWLANGLGSAEACVFYRDGSIYKLINSHNCADGAA